MGVTRGKNIRTEGGLDGLILYLDAANKNSYSGSGTKYTLTSGHFNGDIAVVKVYNKTLSASEVLSNYNLLKGRFL